MRMSPLGNPCPHIKQIDTFVFCSIYPKRPDICARHDFPFNYCPIGIDVLGLQFADQVSQRIDAGYELTKSLSYNEEVER